MASPRFAPLQRYPSFPDSTVPPPEPRPLPVRTVRCQGANSLVKERRSSPGDATVSKARRTGISFARLERLDDRIVLDAAPISGPIFQPPAAYSLNHVLVRFDEAHELLDV